MSDDEEPLSLSDTPQLKNKVIKRKVSYDNLLKNKYINYPEEELIQIFNYYSKGKGCCPDCKNSVS